MITTLENKKNAAIIKIREYKNIFNFKTNFYLYGEP